MSNRRIYFGRPGQVAEIWFPFAGVQGPVDYSASAFRTASGGARTQRSLIGVRQYSLDYGGLGDAAFRYLEAFHVGAQGPGPFVYLDPGRRNLLTVNQSSSGSDSGAPDGFLFVGGSGQVLTASAAQTRNIPRSILWTSTAAGPVTAQMRMVPPSREWPGWPVISQPYSFGFWCLGAGSDPTVDFTVCIDWLDLNGGLLSTSASSTFTTSTAWQLLRLENASPPASGLAAFAQPYLAANGATISNGTLLYFSKGQLNEGVILDADWSPGTGIAPVSVLSLGDTLAFAEPGFHKSPVMLLQEVGL